MVKESYVSFETAKLLKEKGFDEPCFCINYPLPERGYHNIILPNLLNNSMIPLTDEYKFCRYKEDFITIPTLQLAMAWLRETHKLHIEVEAYPHEDGCFYWCYRIMHLCKNGRIFGYYKKLLKAGFDSYEEAVEASIKACLENLI